MSTRSAGTTPVPTSLPSSLTVTAGAAAVAGVLAAGVVWASQLWSLPPWDEPDPGDAPEWDVEGNQDEDGWWSDPDEREDPDDWSLDLDSDRSRWGLRE